MYSRPPIPCPAPSPETSAVFPQTCEPLEEVSAAQPADAATALAFALDRLAGRGGDARPVALVTTPSWLRERGRPFGRGMARWGMARLIWVRVEREAEALWALEEALKSGAVAGGLASVEQPAFVATRRLAFAARTGAASGILLRAQNPHVQAGADLSAARRRWRIAALGSGPAAFDAQAPGPARLRAELVRRRDGPPGAWDLEQDDETHRLRVVAGLADHGVDEIAAAGGRRGARAA
jgi:protein ImuA